MKAGFFAQLKTLLWRNILLKRRNKGQLFQILIVIKSAVQPDVKPAAKFPVNHLADFPFHTSRPVFVTAPSGFDVDTTMAKISARLNGTQFLQYQTFTSQQEAEDKYLNSSQSDPVGIMFGYKSASEGGMNYAIRMSPGASVASDQVFTKDQGDCREDNADGASRYGCDVNKYLVSGFAQLQSAINQVLTEKETSSTLPSTEVDVQMMPKDEYTPNLTVLLTISSIYFVLAYTFFINFLTVNLVAEKEKKIREGMLMMGLRNSVFWLSWSLLYFVLILVVTVLITYFAVTADFFENSNPFLLFLLLMLYGMTIIALAFLLTPFFNKAKPAGLVASFSTLLLSMMYLVVSQTRMYTNDGIEYDVPVPAQWAMCLLSPCALALALDKGIYLDIVKGGMNFDTINEGFFPLYAPLVMLLVDVILYFLLAIYLDHVIPGEFGPRYSPLYFLQWSYWFPKQHSSYRMNGRSQGDNEDVITGPNIEPVLADMRSKCTLRIRDITKIFKSKKVTTTAVMRKTTLINMLTGVVPPTSGTATINGLDVTSSGDMEEIRTMCGICPQHNILYDELTAEEHLQIFAGIKGVPTDKMASEVSQSLKDVDMSDQAAVRSSKLSGGQKRKLSVAMALIGDPKIIFLDEPTAGMDPYSRRHLWSLLKKSKEGRVILLTTHFMDEADILADRKVIVSKGKLQCVGSSLFLKNRFGIGYHLNMVVKPGCNHETVTAFLQSHVTGIEFQRSHGKELAYTIPLAEVANFAKEMEEVAENEDAVGNPSCNNPANNLTQLGKSPDQNHTAVRSPAVAPKEVLPTVQDDRNRTLQCFLVMMKLRFKILNRSMESLILIIVLPIGLVASALSTSKTVSTDVDLPKPVQLTAAMYAQPQGLAYRALPDYLLVDTVNDATSQNFSDALNATYSVVKYHSGSVSLPHYVGTTIRAFDSTTGMLKSYIALYNDSAVHSLPAIINAISNVVLQLKLGSSSSKNIITYSLPWPDKNKRRFKMSSGSTSSTMIMGIAFTLVAPAFAAGAVSDRQCKSQLRISGMSFHMYWGTTFLFSLLVYLIPATACLTLVLRMQVPSLSTTGAVVMLILLFVTFIPACLMLSLVCSFFFENFETAQAVLANVFMMAGLIPYMAVSISDIFGWEHATTLHYIFLFIDPVYSIFGGFYYIDKVYFKALFMETETTVGDYFLFENKILICLLANLLDLFVGYLLLRILDVRSNGGSIRDALSFGFSNLIQDTPEDNTDRIMGEDEDVAKERERVEMLERSGAGGELRKVFIKNGSKQCWKKTEADEMKVAVRNLSFAVNKGEVFGLLGPNGAGKTTALSMMTGEVHPTQGKVVVANHQIHSNMSDALQWLGFCPQHDPLWDQVTLGEHFEVYAAELSGGTKRKLCYAMSMLGNPRVVLLDEPSTGMDPKSKRFLWDTISSSFEGQDRGAILTTHYMEEADALCTRVAIMVNGQMECLGPTQHLKSKYGSGYLLEVKLGGSGGATNEMLEQRVQEFERHLMTLFPNATCLESFAERAQYKIPSEDVGMLSATFTALESTKQTHRVEEYSFSQSTLEQVFLNFAKKQLEEGEDIENLEIKDPAARALSSANQRKMQTTCWPIYLQAVSDGSTKIFIMMIKEYRICMPLSVEEYRIGQLFMIAKHSHEQSEKGEGVEVVKNEAVEDPAHGRGQYTEKRCSFIPKFSIHIETRYEDNNGTSENCLGLSEDELQQREVDFVDIAFDELPAKHYKEAEDLRVFKSQKTGRGPLEEGWRERTEPIMCSYKLARVKFEVFGLQTKVESFTHKSVRDILLLGHRQAFAWIDDWYGLGIDDIREYEEKMNKETNQKVLAGRGRHSRSSTASTSE
ncbi:hypothetical protein BaRGS_00002231 [Batillaria attramentaria]|uniref:ABC transporter domain-containing protein n=1 Tax=Batillaria attramentaria TaxID=370345 RepID=A0ABD0M4T0_9CAEN